MIGRVGPFQKLLLIKPLFAGLRSVCFCGVACEAIMQRTVVRKIEPGCQSCTLLLKKLCLSSAAPLNMGSFTQQLKLK